jgi:hypothetical protein
MEAALVVLAQKQRSSISRLRRQSGAGVRTGLACSKDPGKRLGPDYFFRRG